MEPAVVRALLDRALEVAREGEAARPVVSAPKELVRYLGFQRLTGPALDTVWRVLDGDEAFRARVLEATTPEEVGAAGWLALVRPPGWADVLDAVVRAQGEAAGERQAEKRLRDLQRALEAADRKREHAEAEVERQREEVEAATEELAAVRRERRRADDALAAVERRAEELAQKLVDRDNRLAEAQGAREAREHELAETRRRLADAEAEVARRPEPAVPGQRAVDVEALRATVERLGRAAATLGRAVDAVQAEVPPEPVVLDGPAGTPRRSAVALPGGVVADTADGARWLFARPGVVVLVDGYNVAKRAWPDADLEAQRNRLIRLLDELAARAGLSVEVVFDGPEDPAPTARQGTPSVGVRYSGGTLADDVVVDLVDAQPAGAPVVVVSSDGEVREGARQRGANVIGAETLLAVAT